MDNKPETNYSVEVAKEKQKTLRWGMFIGAFFILGAAAIFLGKNLKINVKEGQLEVSKPLIEQVNQPTKSDTGTSTTFTTGKIDKNLAQEIKALPGVDPNHFTGKNYINNEYNYLFSCDNPEKYNIAYRSSNYNSGDPINYIDAGDGIEFKLIISDNDQNTTMEELINLLTSASAMINGMQPEVTYADGGKTAFFKTYVKAYLKYAIIKIILTPERGFIAGVYYPEKLANDPRKLDLEKMVATLTLF